MSLHKAAKTFNIPYSTLQERVKYCNHQSPVLGRHSVFLSEEEDRIAEHVKKICSTIYDLTPLQLREAPYIFAT